MTEKLDRRRKYYIILDCETATLPCASEYEGSARKDIAIAKPLIYDLGWQVVDNKGVVYRRRNYLITEIFSVPSIFDTAYYAAKRPIYLERLEKGEITLTDWKSAAAVLEQDLQEVTAVGAYNSMFDFKKAIPFTEKYIEKLYSPDFNSWYYFQEKLCHNIAIGDKPKNENFDGEHFLFRDVEYPLFDLWGLSARHLLNCDEYKQKCVENDWKTKSGKYFSTTAEATFRFIGEDTSFEESHTAIDDAEIETKIFVKVHKKTRGKWEKGIIYFPFRELGYVEDFMIRNGIEE